MTAWKTHNGPRRSLAVTELQWGHADDGVEDAAVLAGADPV
jgi:hypothetical protein